MSQEPLDFGSDQPNDGESLKSAFGKIDRMTGELYALLNGCQSQLAAQAKKDVVTSFRSRAGAVVPQAGDYSAAQVSVAPAGGLAATDVQSALVELDSEAAALNTKVTALSGQVAAAQKQAGVASFKSRAGAVVPQAGDYSADQVNVTPSGGLAATDVQSALVELDSEAAALNTKVTAVESKAGDAAEKLKTLDALSAKVTTLETKGAGVASFKSRAGAVVPQAGDYSAAQVSVAPSGGLASRDVQAALLELDSEATALSAKVTALETKGAGVASFKTRAGAVVPQAGDYSADQVNVTPSGGLAATDVQSALVELDSEATALSAKVTAVESKAGVASFKTRTGAVAPQAGDYSADQVSVTPAGGLASRDVQSALLELNRKSGNAAQVSFAPSGGLTATTVQAALVELDQKKLGMSATNLAESAATDGDWIASFNVYRTVPTKTTVGKLFTGRILTTPVLTGYRETVESQNVTTASHALSDISLGNVKRLTLTVDTTLTLPNLSLTAGTGAALSVVIVQDGTGNRSVTFATQDYRPIVWDCNTSQPAIATGSGEETLFSFYRIAESPVWKGVRVHKGG